MSDEREMPQEIHPAFETLLPWQAGELGQEEHWQIERHLRGCQSCREILAEVEALYGEAGWASSHAAQRAMHARLELERRPSRWRIRSSWPAAVAASLIAALILFTTMDLTPEARADTLLSRAVKREAELPFHAHVLRFVAGDDDCRITVMQPLTQTVEQETSTGSLCRAVDEQLRSAGWGWKDALSAESFQRWRSSLPHKHDVIRKLEEATEVDTQTDSGPIREAVLRLRNSDDRPLAGRIVFAGLNSSIQIEEAPYVPVTVASASAADRTPIGRPPEAIPTFTPLDCSEAEARLALHRIGADTNVLLAVDLAGDAVRVWGVAPTAAAKSSIEDALAGIPDVTVMVVTEAEEKASHAPVPWQAVHGSSLPLAYEQVNELYHGDPDGQQAFLTELDSIGRGLVGEARFRDALVVLASRAPSSPYGRPLQGAKAEMEAKLVSDERLLEKRLTPVYVAFHRKLPERLAPMSYRQAAQAYLLIHRLFLADDRNGGTSADLALERLEKLFS